MYTNQWKKVAGTLVLLSAVGRGASAQCEQEELAPVTGDESVSQHPLAFGQFTQGFQIGAPGDSDRFHFDAGAGDVIRASVLAFSGHHLDPRLEIYDPSFAPLFDSWCSGGVNAVGCVLTTPNLTLPSTGRYWILVSDQQNDNTGTYELSLERVFPFSSRARVIGYDVTALDDVSPWSDLDVFQFEGFTASRVRISWLAFSGDHLDPRLELYDPSGDLVAGKLIDTWCSGGVNAVGCVLTSEVDLVLTGTYTILLSDQQRDNTGRYSISVSCLLGNCPVQTAAVVRNGSGVNPPCYSSPCPPVLGGRWIGRVDASSVPNATATAILFTGAPLAPAPTRYGELLIDLSRYRFCSVVPLAPGETMNQHTAQLPRKAALAGSLGFSQAAIMVGPRVVTLCNAIDYTLGY